jgi:acyl-CoA thioesterase FadM
MNLYLRLLWALLSSLPRDRLHYSSTAESAFRVLPHDLDAFGHMNNGRYLQIMDVARTEWMLRTGVFGAIRRQRWAPILGGGFVRFRFSLRLMQRYRVRTRLLGWDRRWFYLEHAFIDARERCVAKGVTRAALRASGAWVDAHEIAELVHPGAESPEIPAWVTDWMALEDAMYRFEHDVGDGVVELRRVS